MADARFEDVGEGPLRLVAADADDLTVVSSVCQDAVGKIERVHWMPRRRRFSMLLYRFRWEDAERASREKRAYERVAAALNIDDVMSVRSSGIDRLDKEAVFSVLRIGFEPAEDGSGRLLVDCAGGAGFAFDVECVNVSLTDLTRPWAAGGMPVH